MGELRSLAVGGVLLTVWALEAGWARDALSRRLGAEGWVKIYQGAWAVPGARVDLRMRLFARQAAVPRLVVSHRSAAALWRIEVLRDEVVEFTDPAAVARHRGVRVHRLAVPSQDIQVRQGLRVTGVPRTLADLLRGGPRDEALIAVDSALTRRTVRGIRRGPLAQLGAIEDALDAPLLGASRARRWLALADPLCGSPAETVARLRMRDAGLYPESQVTLVTPNGRICRPDFLFRAAGLVVEIEGYAYHGSRDAHRRDIDRFNEVALCPEVRAILRFTAEDVSHHPDRMIARIRNALAHLGS
ncbi:PDDEXK family nuclease [Streptomyces ureilyticus]|uniref:DUF559 domain-containing protein n=1 Tax=Streptomyces ureilyticus TaxID=1775131 RepID=A0ABX0DZS2_9ACTN|nr:hypothetical protein [Streptomyces ureilyticus]NGO46852.1 hypothetical protein [Streptomyces ureilyticus]